MLILDVCIFEIYYLILTSKSQYLGTTFLILSFDICLRQETYGGVDLYNNGVLEQNKDMGNTRNVDRVRQEEGDFWCIN